MPPAQQYIKSAMLVMSLMTRESRVHFRHRYPVSFPMTTGALFLQLRRQRDRSPQSVEVKNAVSYTAMTSRYNDSLSGQIYFLSLWNVMSLGLHTVWLYLLQIDLYLQQISIYNSDVCKLSKAEKMCFTASLLLMVYSCERKKNIFLKLALTHAQSSGPKMLCRLLSLQPLAVTSTN